LVTLCKQTIDVEVIFYKQLEMDYNPWPQNASYLMPFMANSSNQFKIEIFTFGNRKINFHTTRLVKNWFQKIARWLVSFNMFLSCLNLFINDHHC
jgi:hypothetical protein